VIALAKVVLPIERRLNNVDDSIIRADLAALPAQLDQIDQYIADGVLNGEQPNAADLQIAPSVRLLHTLDDVRPLLAGRPAEDFAFRWFPQLPASVPTGALAVQTAAQAATLPAA
jgi:glutathione S-transferase